MSKPLAEQKKLERLNEILESHPKDQASLIQILQEVQAEYNYLPEEVLTYIATALGLSPTTVFGVATFYAQFSLQPKGKYEIKVCDGTACHVRGSMPVLNAIHKSLNLQDGKFTTEDGLFSVETVSCLGACGLAPVVVVNGKVYPQMTADAIKIVIETIMSEEKEGN